LAVVFTAVSIECPTDWVKKLLYQSVSRIFQFQSYFHFSVHFSSLPFVCQCLQDNLEHLEHRVSVVANSIALLLKKTLSMTMLTKVKILPSLVRAIFCA
jgi:hypothetical protein